MEDPIDHIAPKLNYQYKFKIVPVVILSFLAIAMTVLKEMNVPGGAFFGLLFTSILAGFSIFSFLILRGTSMLNNVYFGLSIIWICVLVWGAFFNGGYPFNWRGLSYIFPFILLINLIGFLFYRSKKKRLG